MRDSVAVSFRQRMRHQEKSVRAMIMVMTREM